MRGKPLPGLMIAFCLGSVFPNELEFSSSGLQGPQWGLLRLNLGA